MLGTFIEFSKIMAKYGQLSQWPELVAQDFGTSWINWHVPFHIFHFSPKTLRELLADTGFTCIEIRSDHACPVGGPVFDCRTVLQEKQKRLGN